MSPSSKVPLVIFGPSGVGKGTLLKRLFAEFPDGFGFSVSHTTRAPRPGETDGKEYHFTTPEKFKDLIQCGAFIEHAQFSGNFYGTSFQTVRHVAETGRRCVLDIDAQGVQQIKRTDLNPIYLFISPPSMTVLRERLRGRATDSEEAIQKRLSTALKEIQYAREPNVYDYVIVNDDLEKAYEKFRQVALGQEVNQDMLPPLDD
ncbi:guanylate kinase [Leucogyrophana mollusca]|uniref:Guanylate kinase n=1 Tax=Leucogyrophana mollusca TaxID=85980 RepID=A0ACB8BPP4_9AGAM|nr:guanylate kinase [Leucogyrophana mollusca]